MANWSNVTDVLNGLLSFGSVRFKLISGPFIGLLVVYLLRLDGNVAKVIILQASMPAAILTYLIAAQNNSYEQEIGTAVFVSTIGSIVSIPIILFFLL